MIDIRRSFASAEYSITSSYILLFHISDQNYWSKGRHDYLTIFYCQITHKPETDLNVGVFGLTQLGTQFMVNLSLASIISFLEILMVSFVKFIGTT